MSDVECGTVTKGTVTSGTVTSGTVVLMAREPVPGTTKTRLEPALGPAGAAALATAMLHDAVALLRQIADDDPGVHLAVASAPVGERPLLGAIVGGIAQIDQVGATLGERLDHVMHKGLAGGRHWVVALASDAPLVAASDVRQIIDRLRAGADVVLGPCDDGGYWSIGTRQRPGELTTGVTMSTATVTADTLAIADRLGLHWQLGAVSFDVDEPQDLERLAAELASDPARAPHTSRALDER